MLRLNRYMEAANLHFLIMQDSILNEVDEKLTAEVKRMIQSDQYWEVNDYEEFLRKRDESSFREFFTPYTIDDLKRNGVTTYKLKGFDIGYALVPLPNGKVDIISVFNNEKEVRGIIDELIESAINHGGNSLDHYDTKLSDMYARNGFVEKERYKWDDQYMHPEWDKNKWGEPDVIVRELDPELRKSLKLNKALNQ